jgi:hypothetical protein
MRFGKEKRLTGIKNSGGSTPTPAPSGGGGRTPPGGIPTWVVVVVVLGLLSFYLYGKYKEHERKYYERHPKIERK